jgi:hypothetical protein
MGLVYMLNETKVMQVWGNWLVSMAPLMGSDHLEEMIPLAF